MDETFGQMVRRYRKARRLTQERLAELAEIDQSTVSQVELDKGDRTVRIVTNLAVVFGEDPLAWLVLAGVVAQDAPREPDPPFDKSMTRAYVEQTPSPWVRDALAAEKLRRTPASYAALLDAIFGARDRSDESVIEAIRRIEREV